MTGNNEHEDVETQAEPPPARDWVTTEFIKEGSRPQTRETKERQPDE